MLPLEESELPPHSQGCGGSSINTSEYGHQRLGHYPSRNAWLQMAQPPTQHEKTGETLLRLKLFPDKPK